MHRFYVNEKLSQGVTAVLNEEESAHAARVLRLRAGEAVQLLDGENLWDAQLCEVNPQQTTASVIASRPSPEASVHVTLFQGLPKADKMERIVQKGTELGAWAFLPVEMERSVSKADNATKDEKKRVRLSRIALEAAKQSGRAHVPQMLSTLSFDKALKYIEAEAFDLVLVAWEEEHALPLTKAIEEHIAQRHPLTKAIIVIGPEGGISEAEWQRLKAIGAVSVTLGSRILRTETAGLVSLAAMWSALGEM